MQIRRKREQVVAAAEPQQNVWGHRSPEQMAEALEKARRVRAARKEKLDQIRSGAVSLADLLGPDYENDQVVGRILTHQMLRALPGVGPVRAAKIMDDLGIRQNRRVGGLGRETRARLLDWNAARTGKSE